MPALREQQQPSSDADATLGATVVNGSHTITVEETADGKHIATPTHDHGQQADYAILESIPVAMGMAAPAVAMAVWESTFSLSSLSPKAKFRHTRRGELGDTTENSAFAKTKKAVRHLNQTASDLQPAARKRFARPASLRGTANMVMKTASSNQQTRVVFVQPLGGGQAQLDT